MPQNTPHTPQNHQTWNKPPKTRPQADTRTFIGKQFDSENATGKYGHTRVNSTQMIGKPYVKSYHDNQWRDTMSIQTDQTAQAATEILAQALNDWNSLNGEERHGEVTKAVNILTSADSEPTDAYDTKTISVHCPEQGRSIYFTITWFNGEQNALGDIGFTGEYFHFFAVMSSNESFQTASTSPHGLARKLPDWFQNSPAFELIYALDNDKMDWDSISDGDRFHAADVEGFE